LLTQEQKRAAQKEHEANVTAATLMTQAKVGALVSGLQATLGKRVRTAKIDKYRKASIMLLRAQLGREIVATMTKIKQVIEDDAKKFKAN
jgi:outer membrane PBP1 activator LpoA protein